MREPIFCSQKNLSASTLCLQPVVMSQNCTPNYCHSRKSPRGLVLPLSHLRGMWFTLYPLFRFNLSALLYLNVACPRVRSQTHLLSSGVLLLVLGLARTCILMAHSCLPLARLFPRTPSCLPSIPTCGSSRHLTLNLRQLQLPPSPQHLSLSLIHI